MAEEQMPSVRQRHSALEFAALVFGALTVFESIYAATLNLTAASVAAAAIVGAAAAGIAFQLKLRSGRRQSSVLAPDDASKRRAGWPSRIFAVGCVFFAFAALGGLGDQNLSPQAKAGLVSLAVALVALAVDAVTGRLAADIRRLRAAARENRRLGGALYGTIFGACLLGVIGFGGFVSINGLRTDGARAPALITNVTHFRATTYFLRYTTATGQSVTCSTENVKGAPRPGSYITVLYERQRPSLNCEDARLGTSFVEPIVLTAISLALLAASRWIYIRARRRS